MLRLPGYSRTPVAAAYSSLYNSIHRFKSPSPEATRPRSTAMVSRLPGASYGRQRDFSAIQRARGGEAGGIVPLQTVLWQSPCTQGRSIPSTPATSHWSRRPRGVFGEVVVAVLGNPAKAGLFTKPERVELVSACVATLPNVRVISHEGMAVEAAADVGATCIVRSGHKERGAEFDMAAMNHALSAIPTVFLDPNEETNWVSSTLVRSAAADGSLASLGSAVPAPVLDAINRRQALDRAAGR
jgi:pantetheine-phosphate adenylyltransferase